MISGHRLNDFTKIQRLAVAAGKHANTRPRSADDDSRSERSDTSDATPESPANSGGSLMQNSPLDCLYELANKAFDRINGEKSIGKWKLRLLSTLIVDDRFSVPK